MKTLILFSFVLISMTAQAAQLESFLLKRAGPGQYEAVFTAVDSRVMLKLETCNFQDASHIPAISLSNPVLVNDVMNIINGRAVIASDMSAQDFPLPKSWLQLKYKAVGDNSIVTVQRPFIVMNGALSDVLMRIDAVSKVICYRNGSK